MQRRNGNLLYSASDLVTHLECAHATTLALQDLDERLPRAEDDASAKLIQDKGMEHEKAALAAFRAQGLRIDEIPEHGDPSALMDATLAAMRDGADVIYQGTLVAAPLYGRTDFLRRVERPSNLGGHSYEVVDTKLARSAKAKFAVQLAFYSDLLAGAQGLPPHDMHLTLGDGKQVTFPVTEYAHYVADVRERFLAFAGEHPNATYPQRCAACGTCAWRDICADRWKEDDHLNQVTGITRNQIERLNAAGIDTMAALATVTASTKVHRVAGETLAKLGAQSALQVERRTTGEPRYEILPLDGERRRGFHRLPQPDAGDVFFDMEGDPLEEGGLEYLFGVRYVDGGEPKFKAFWAHDRAEERRAFEAFIDFMMERVRRFPGLHVYHYSHYEPTALKRLMTLHGTREAQLDNLLRGEKFVDLYKVVREGIRTSEPGLSIKDIEVFYMPPRQSEIRDAGASIVHYERWRLTRDAAELGRIRDYNEDDCKSTHLLHYWLLQLRPQGLPWFQVRRDEDAKKEQERSERTREIEARLEAYRATLLVDLPREAARTADDHERALVFDLLDFHRRTAKPEWWAQFARQDMTEDELVEDLECLGGIRRNGTLPVPEKRSFLYEFEFPEQETKLRAGKTCTRCDTRKDFGEVVAIDQARRVVTLKIGPSAQIVDRLSIGPPGPINTDALRDAVWRVADAIVARDDTHFHAARAFLRRDPPRLRGWDTGAPVIEGNVDLRAEALRAVEALDDSYLFIQGPPGAGKTTIGSRLIVDLLRAGKRVGVTSNSHKVIHNLLNAVEERAAEASFEFAGCKKSSDSDAESVYESRNIRDGRTNAAVAASGARLVAGTAWLFADPDFEAGFDYIFVDEAGQVSLANLVAIATGARNLVLLGDHMQLGQPIQGVHPGRSGESALDFLLDGQATIASDRGIFLPTSFRMHEDVCRFISDAVYDGRLAPDAANQRRRLVLDASAHPALRPTGIRFHPVTHEGCKQRSQAEADVLRDIVANLRTQRWIEKDGSERPIALDNILVVAPYNSQVNLLREVLPPGMRVGTIDKFQGQQAAVVLVSMTTSSGDDMPRNIEFLYDKNRLNVAVSRAQCLAVVVASPELLHIQCNSPAQMALVNTLCWLKEYADGLPT